VRNSKQGKLSKAQRTDEKCNHMMHSFTEIK
jgi:hypothetical protein